MSKGIANEDEGALEENGVQAKNQRLCLVHSLSPAKVHAETTPLRAVSLCELLLSAGCLDFRLFCRPLSFGLCYLLDSEAPFLTCDCRHSIRSPAQVHGWCDHV